MLQLLINYDNVKVLHACFCACVFVCVYVSVCVPVKVELVEELGPVSVVRSGTADLRQNVVHR